MQKLKKFFIVLKMNSVGSVRNISDRKSTPATVSRGMLLKSCITSHLTGTYFIPLLDSISIIVFSFLVYNIGFEPFGSLRLFLCEFRRDFRLPPGFLYCPVP